MTKTRHRSDRVRLSDSQATQLQDTGSLRLLVPVPRNADEPEVLAAWDEKQWLDYYTKHAHANYNFEDLFQLPVACERATGISEIEGLPYLLYTFGRPSSDRPVYATFARWTPGDWDNPAAPDPVDFFKKQHIALSKVSRSRGTSAKSNQKNVNLNREAFDAFDTYYNFVFENSGTVSKQAELSRLIMLAIEHFGNLSEPVRRTAEMLPDAQTVFVRRIVSEVQALRPAKVMRRYRPRVKLVFDPNAHNPGAGVGIENE